MRITGAASEVTSRFMRLLLSALFLSSGLLAGCASKPAISVAYSGIGKGDLKGRTIAVCGFTATDSGVYPGQVQEMAILNDAWHAVRLRCKRSQVPSLQEAWAMAGVPPARHAPGVPVILGRNRTPAYMQAARANGIDYLLWIDMLRNTVERHSGHWLSTRTEYPSCGCGKIGDSDCRGSSDSSCCGGCGSSCRQGNEVTEYHSSETATRRLGASYSLVDAATGRPVWRTDAAYSRSSVNTSTSESGYPMLPAAPLPPEESQIMKRMTRAAIDKLPR